MPCPCFYPTPLCHAQCCRIVSWQICCMHLTGDCCQGHAGADGPLLPSPWTHCLVDVSFNLLYALPHEIGRLTSLTILRLAYNDLELSSMTLDTLQVACPRTPASLPSALLPRLQRASVHFRCLEEQYTLRALCHHYTCLTRLVKYML